MEVQFSYRQSELLRNYLRSLFGLAICAAPFIWLKPATYLIVILVAMGAIFAVLLWQTIMRQITRVTLDQNGIALTDWRKRRIDWANLRTLHLAYYEPWNLRKSDAGRAAIRRGYRPQDLGHAADQGNVYAVASTTDSGSGFLELKLQGGGQTIQIGSSLVGFRDVVARATQAAGDNSINFKAATIANLLAIGIADPRLDSGLDGVED